MAFYGVLSGVSGKIPGKLWDNFRIYFPEMFLKFLGFQAPERQTCREPQVDTALDLVPTFWAGCFSRRGHLTSRVCAQRLLLGNLEEITLKGQRISLEHVHNLIMLHLGLVVNAFCLLQWEQTWQRLERKVLVKFQGILGNSSKSKVEFK